MGILLSIDLGTEGARVGAFTEDGRVLGTAHRPYGTRFPRPGWAEQDPRDWWAALTAASRELLDGQACRGAGAVVAIAASTTASTVAVLDGAGEPLRPAILWMDCRSGAESALTAELVDEHPILKWSGGSDASEWLVPKAMWLHTHEPDIYRSAARIVEAVDYVTFRLTGEWVGSQMNAVCKYNYDTLAGRFPDELYRALGVPDLTAKLPDRIVAVGGVAGALHPAAAADLGITGSPVVAVGGIDAHVSLLACGAELHGLVSLVSGTSSAIIAEVDEPTDTREIWGPYPRALHQDKWLVEGGQVASGSVLKWAGESIMGVARQDLPALIDEAAAVDPATHGLHALDYFMGNRTPYREPRLRGTVVGLSLGTTKAELYRAMVEAVACGTRSVVDSFERAGVSCERLVFSGGIERNTLWQQVTVDVLGRPAELVVGENLTLRACAVIAATAAGVTGSLDEGSALFAPTVRILEPDPARIALYQNTFGEYQRLTEIMAPFMRDSADALTARTVATADRVGS
ncbi:MULTISPECIES: FGGY-family carbohydrate kinase [Mycobacteriaceae]|uniref:Sugar kinase n=1 Tax=Mycolicibacterium neoaurum VKM Ac-1815D TaxID=700508 RepID=V5X9Q0_MYCNE|nr:MULTISPECIES: FGGY-family carbohydrate kinase [Mycobacteriaceae]AHC25180.1 sugar kinase [Mycolicibacterium neoaurum VKM Ac-1815D]AMO05678.1 sugar kinase [Mycolicibacterium neoaurum]AXK75998.1 sugar kinase [Mycolicibacterium neoaurum]KJQ49473.1 sugar kinase [Mycolicibacterium neoaurum]KUM09111.1 sugar kinase [Mycolicibacterium neoaurum]